MSGLRWKPSTCDTFQKEVRYLGHLVSDPNKVVTVRKWARPTNLQVQAYLGFIGYYSSFFTDFATLAKLLNRLTSKEAEFVWGEAQEYAASQLRTGRGSGSSIPGRFKGICARH